MRIIAVAETKLGIFWRVSSGASAGADLFGARQVDPQGTETADTDEIAAQWAHGGGSRWIWIIILKEGPSVAATQGAPQSARPWLVDSRQRFAVRTQLVLEAAVLTRDLNA
jgi:hypothetical protein